MLTYADCFNGHAAAGAAAAAGEAPGMTYANELLTYADVCERMRTYADVLRQQLAKLQV